MPDLAELGIRVRSDEAVKGSRDLDKLTASGAKAETSVDRLGKTAQDTESRLNRMVGPLRVVVGLLASVGVGLSLTNVIGSFAEFERALIGVGKTTNITGSQLDALGKDIQQLTRVLPNTAEELAEIAQSAGQLGVTGSENILKFTKTVAQLGSASNLAGEEAASTLARILTITGEAFSQIDVFGSVIVRLGNNFAATEAEIASAATRVAQATALFGTSSAEVAAIGTALTAVGVQAEAGGTIIGKSFQAINRAVNEGGKELAVLTRITGQTQQELKTLFDTDPAAAFQEMVEALGALESSQVPSVLDELGLSGERSVQVLGTLSTRASVLADALQQANDEVENVTALTKEAETAQQAFANQMLVVRNNAAEVAVAIGALFAPSALSGAKTLGEGFKSLADNIDLVVTAAELAAIAVGSRLVVAVVAATAARTKEVLATQAAAKATVEQTAFTLAAAQAEVRMATAMEIGNARRVALAAAASRAAAAQQAHTVALQNASIAARAAAGAMGLLNRAMAFFGGPLGLAITAVAGSMLLFSKNADAAQKSSEDLNRSVKNLAGSFKELNAAQLRGALVENRSSIADLEKQRTLAAAQLETLIKQSRFTKDLQKTNDELALARAKLATATKDVTAAEELQVKLQRQLKDVEDGTVKTTDDFTEANNKATKSLTDQQKEIKDLIDGLRVENSQLGRMVQATSEGERAIADLNTEIEIENALRKEGIDAKSEEGQMIAELIRSNAQLKESIEDNADAYEEVAEASTKAQKEQERAAKAAADALAQPFKNAITGIQNAFTQGFRDMLDGNVKTFEDFGNTLLDIFKQILAEMATLAIAKPIIVPVVQALGGLLGVPGAAGQALTSAFGGAASGAGGGLLAGAGGLALSPLGAGALAFGGGALIGNLLGGSTQSTIGGGIGGFAGGLGGLLLGSGSGGAFGATLGATFGSALPIVGTILGGIAGSYIGSLFGNNKPNKQRTAFGTSPNLSGFEQNISREGPFGFVGLANTLTNNDVSSQTIQAMTNLIIAIDESTAQFLDASEIQRVSNRLQSRPGLQLERRGGLTESDVFYQTLDRLRTIMSTVSNGSRELTDMLADAADELPKTEAGIRGLIEAASGILAARSALREAIDSFGVIVEPLSQIEVAIQAIKDRAVELTDAAKQFGLNDTATINQISAGRDQALANLRDEFDKQVSDAILGFVDPVTLAIQEFEVIAQQRLDDAKALGADILAVERLNAIERIRVIEQANSQFSGSLSRSFDDLQKFVDSLGLSNLSPLSPEQRLKEAQSQFDRTLALAQQGDTESIQNLAGVSQALLQEAQSFFGNTAEFKEIFADVNSDLGDLLSQNSINQSDRLVTAINDSAIATIQSTTELLDEIRLLRIEVIALRADNQELNDSIALLQSGTAA